MMKQLVLLFLFLPVACSLASNDPRVKDYEKQAAGVTIIRDQWGIPHIYGKTDADAVFGLMYLQCEESFERVERAYIEKFGRLAEVEGETRLYEDLTARLIYDTSAAIADYGKSPGWLKKLLHAFADGINYYLYKNPDVKPVLLNHFEPWFPLLFTDGGYTAMQTGGLEISDMKRLYASTIGSGSSSFHNVLPTNEPTGSNGFAIAPSKSDSKNALLYINPHVSFYFRTEAHIVSEEGLNAYGAVTWGQFFVFQGFNQHCGWMHTSSMADAADLYEEKVSQKNSDFFYEYDGQLKKVSLKSHLFHYKKNGILGSRATATYYTHHGPVMGMRNNKWLSLKEQNRSLNGLIQSWQRTKANNYEEFRKTMQLESNSSTNTMYADDKGDIAYWHGNFIPKRNAKFDWKLPVDGSITDTEWEGIHDLNEIVHLHNPKQGWIQNCNSTPFNASGFNTLDKNKYPAYMAPDGENFRSLFAIKELEKEGSFNLDKLIALGYNRYLAIFDSLLPPLFEAYSALSPPDPAYSFLQEPINQLKSWDKKSDVNSVATTLAIEWGYNIIYNGYKNVNSELTTDQVKLFTSFSKNTSPKNRVNTLVSVVQGLQNAYGTWKVAWGEINRYQRNGGHSQKFDDDKESLPVGMASALFGSLPAFETVWNGTRKGYGVAGNSFIAAVEFGKRVKAKAITTGGQSFDPHSNHFTDQASMYAEGKFRDVLFYKEDVVKNPKQTYHPGEKL